MPNANVTSTVDRIVERVTRRVVSESLDTSGLSGSARDVYTASSDRIEVELTNITAVVDKLAVAVGSPIIAAKIVSAYVSEITYGDREADPDVTRFSMPRSVRAVAQQHQVEVHDACDDVKYIFEELDAVVSQSHVPPAGVSSVTATIITAHLNDYIFSHGG